MIDKKKLDTAILYLQRIADGKNLVNNMPAEEDTILNNDSFNGKGGRDWYQV